MDASACAETSPTGMVETTCDPLQEHLMALSGARPISLSPPGAGQRATEGPGAFFGWRVVWAAFVVAVFGWGLGFYGPPIYLEAVRAARGWPVALVSGAVTVHFLAG